MQNTDINPRVPEGSAISIPAQGDEVHWLSLSVPQELFKWLNVHPAERDTPELPLYTKNELSWFVSDIVPLTKDMS